MNDIAAAVNLDARATDDSPPVVVLGDPLHSEVRNS